MFYVNVFCNYSLRVGFGYFFFEIYRLYINLTALGKGFQPLPIMLNQDYNW